MYRQSVSRWAAALDRGGALTGEESKRPRLLLSDEPTEGIQPSIIKHIKRVIGLFRDRGDIAIVPVGQYFAFARDLNDALAVMDRGRIVLSGSRGQMVEADVRRHLTV